MLTQGLIAEGRLTPLFDFSVPMTEEYFLITPPEKWVNAAGRAFSDWLRAEFKGVMPERTGSNP